MDLSDNLVLVGPMGAGKSTVGRYLAQLLRLKFIDADIELETRCGADIPWIFEIEGEAGFRIRETELLNELCDRKNIVLATGGGAVLSEKNRDVLKSCGKVVYLYATPQQILKRTCQDKKRPLLQVENRKEAIERLVVERDPLYREIADLIVESEDGLSPQSLAEKVVVQLRYLD